MVIIDKIVSYLSSLGVSGNIRPLPRGNWNENYLVDTGDRKLVLKIYSSGCEGFRSNSARIEYISLRALERTSLVPRPIHLDGSRTSMDKDVLIYEYVPGETLKGFDDAKIPALAKMLSVIHLQDPYPLRKAIKTYASDPKDMIRRLSTALEKHRSEDRYAIRLRESLDHAASMSHMSHPYRSSIIHTDLVPSNIIEYEGSFFLIDWQSPRIGDPAFDIWAMTSSVFNLWDLGSPMPSSMKEKLIEEYIRLTGDLTLRSRIRSKELLWLIELGMYCLQMSSMGRAHVSSGKKGKYEKALRSISGSLEAMK